MPAGCLGWGLPGDDEGGATVAKWRRCTTCRRVLAEGEFEAGSAICRTDEAKSRAPSAGSGPSARSATVTQRAVPAVQRTPVTDIRGRGDAEVRARRARARALDRLAERHAEDYQLLLREERTAEGL
jgi:hypothetical protein